MALAGVSRIKGNGPVPSRVLGYDANALYCHCLEKDIPTGIGALWTPETIGDEVPTENADPSTCQDMVVDNMKIRCTRKWSSPGYAELVAVNCVFGQVQEQKRQLKLSIRHKWNGGQQYFRFGKSRIAVDGWIPELRVIIQFHGCYYHGHDCWMNRGKDRRLMYLNWQRTSRVMHKLETLGHRII